MSARIPVTVLGATGTVGQRLVARLAEHPWFELAYLVSGPRSAGERYDRACAWRVPGAVPYGGLGERVLTAADPKLCPTPLVLSALDTQPAREIEPAFAAAGALLCSNASAFRMDPDVPLLIGEVNPSALDLLETQRRNRKTRGAIVCNPNCTTTGLALALAPLTDLGLESLLMVSLQAISGAGYPGVSALDILNNTIPYIADEEQKVEAETLKILAERGTRATVSAHCNRVPVLDGHSASISLRLSQPAPLDALESRWANFRGLPQELDLPSAPKHPIHFHRAPDRPQPKLDVEHERGMAVHVGRLRPCPLLTHKFQILSHNLERGAAGGALLNAELLRALNQL